MARKKVKVDAVDRTGASLVKADAVAIPLADESVDLIVTSPPYFALRSYTDGGEHYDGQIGSEPTPQAFLEALWAVTAECKRVLKPSGSIWVNLGDKYAGSGGHNNSGISDKSTLSGNGHKGGVGAAGPTKIKATLRSAPDSYNKASIGGARAKSLMGLPWRYAIGCVDQLDLILRAEVVWSKPNGLPESVTDRVRRSHEQWFHMTKEPRYFAAVDEIREPHAYPNDLTRHERGRRNITPHGDDPSGNTSSLDPLGKLPGSVWTIPSEPLKVPEHLGVDHFAAFPQEWPRRIILGWSPSGYCVECGEARVPCVEKELVGVWHDAPPVDTKERGNAEAHRNNRKVVDSPMMSTFGSTAATITGYSCACDQPTAPTRPAVVLDPFGGTGTVAMVARHLCRYGISMDLSTDYLRLANWRVFESGHAEKRADTRAKAEDKEQRITVLKKRIKHQDAVIRAFKARLQNGA